MKKHRHHSNKSNPKQMEGLLQDNPEPRYR